MRPTTSPGTTGPRLAATLAAVLLALGLPAAARAQGFGIYEQSACAMGRMNATVARSCDDGSAIFYNPAGLADGRGLTFSAGATTIVPVGSFTADRTGQSSDLSDTPVFVPHGYATWASPRGLAIGIGLYAPYGLETKWPVDFAGRFSGYDNSLHSIYIQPTVAYRVTPRLSVGAGIALVVGSVKLTQRLDLADQLIPTSFGVPGGTTFGQIGIPPGTDFANVRLAASGATAVAGNFGFQFQATDRIRVGARYLTRATLDYSGTATFTPVPTGIVLPADNPFGVPAGTSLDAVLGQLGLFAAGAPLSNQGVGTSITMPDQLAAGVAVQATDRLTLLADYQWVHWALFRRIDLNFQNPATPDEARIESYHNSSGVRLGGEYALRGDWTVRFGYAHTGAAAPDQTVTPLLPEGARNQFSGGVSWRPTPRLELSAAYLFLRQDDRRGRVTEPAPGMAPTTALNSGLYDFVAQLFGATVTLHY